MFYYKQICSFHLWHRCGNKRCILWSWATEQKSSWYYQINAPVPPSQMLVWRPACAEYDWSARYHQNKTHWQNKFYNSSNSAWASLLLWWITIYSMYWIYRANRASFMNKKLISSNWQTCLFLFCKRNNFPKKPQLDRALVLHPKIQP